MIRLCALLLLAASTLARGAEDEGDAAVRWYHIEVLVFRQPAGSPVTDEQLRYTPSRWLPANVVTLVGNEPPHPDNIGQLLALRDYWAAKTRLARVTPGLDPEIEALIDWARRQARPVDRFHLIASLAALSGLRVPPPREAALPSAAPPPASGEPRPARAEPPPPSVPDMQAAAAPGSGEAAATEPGSLPIPIDLALRSVDAREWLLREEARRLARAGIMIAYHGGWRMPMAPGDAPLAVVLEHDGELLGFLEVTRRRFLHAHLVAWAREPEGFVEMNARVRMRRDQTHLVDHPLLGALVRIERYQYRPAPQ